MPTTRTVRGVDRMEKLRRIGRRRGVLQIVPTQAAVRPAYIRHEDDHELITRPLAAPTGPGAAKGFRNHKNSQIAFPEVHNIYLGPFWGDQLFVEQFSKDIVERGYLQPLRDLNYGTGPGRYLGAIEGFEIAPGTKFHDRERASVWPK